MLPCLHPGVEAQPDYVQQRRGMVAEVRAMVRDTSTYTKMQRLAAPVLVAIDSVPRHEFVPQRLWGVAYDEIAINSRHSGRFKSCKASYTR